MQSFHLPATNAGRRLWRLATVLAALATVASLAQAQNAPSPPSSLAKASRPEPSNLG
ncbi:MAG: hypothetical protein V4795_22180 [Pseudomonadota bacterium]